MKTKTITGLIAAGFSCAMVAATLANADSRTFNYGTDGAAKYDSTPTTPIHQTVNRGSKRDRAAIRAVKSDRLQNFSSADREEPKIRISQ